MAGIYPVGAAELDNNLVDEGCEKTCEKDNSEIRIFLNDHEPNLIGYTFDDDDEQWFLDFKVSLEYPIAQGPFNKLAESDWLPSGIKLVCKNELIVSCQPYFAFTGRFGQYISVRESSPVISKRFNPKLFFRLETENENYLDIEYAHESNGQRVDSAERFSRLVDEFTADQAAGLKNRPQDANDYISRGWDYVGATLKYKLDNTDPDRSNDITFYLSYKNFIGGVFQGDIEEYYPEFEDAREITAREQVDGIRFIAKIEGDNVPIDKIGDEYFSGYKFAFIYETGNDKPFDYNTYKLEFTTRFLTMPVMFWVQSGYNSDLAQYYKDVTSYGIAFEFRTFE